MSRNAIFPFVVAVVLFSVSSLPCVLASTADDEGNGLDSLIDMGALEEETAVYKSDSFAVTATMRKQGTIDVPSNVFVLDRKEIEALCVRDLGDLFYAIPGLDTFRFSDRKWAIAPPGQSYENTNQYLVMVDGAPLPTERSGGADWSSLPVPIDDIERIEYVAGPKTAQYGPYAASGVINIITRRVSPELWDKEKSTASVSGGTQGYGRMSVSVNEQKGKDSYSAWFTYRDSNGFGHPTDPNGNKMVGERNGDKNDGCLGGFSLNHVIDKGRTIRLDTSIYQSTYEDVLTNTSNNHFDTDHRTIITRLLYKDEPSDDKSFEFSIIHQDKRYDFSSAPFGPLRTEVDEKFGNFQIQARHRRTDKKGRTLTFGANYEELTGSGVEYETKAKEDDFSIFGLVDIPVSERNTLLVGLNHYSSSVTGGDFTYNLSMLHKLSPGEVIRTGVGSGIRAPVMTPIHYHTLTLNIPVAPFTVDLIRGNENLDNEQYKQIDLGYERRWRKSSFKADLYWMKSDDRIRVRDEDPTANTQLRFYNEDDALVVKGGTLSYEKQITKKFKGYFAYRYTDSDWENQFQGKYAPKHLFQANMTYKPNYHWSLNMLARSLSDYESSVVNDGGASEINGYTTADLAIFSNTVVL